MDAHLYLRVSTREQSLEGYGIEAQRAKLLTYCSLKDLEVVDVHVDAGVSASIPLADRPAGSAMLSSVYSNPACERKTAGRKRSGTKDEVSGIAIVAMKLDRLFRDASDCLATTRRFDELGIAVHMLDLGVDTATPMGRAFLTIAAAFAELERNLIAERTASGMEQARREGVHTGRAPFGFRHDESGRLIVAPDEIETVRLIVGLRAEDRSLGGIADMLNEMGVATPRVGATWRKSSVRSVIVASQHLLPADGKFQQQGEGE